MQKQKLIVDIEMKLATQRAELQKINAQQAAQLKLVRILGSPAGR